MVATICLPQINMLTFANYHLTADADGSVCGFAGIGRVKVLTGQWFWMKLEETTNVITMYPEGSMNVCSKFNGNQSSSYGYFTKNVNVMAALK